VRVEADCVSMLQQFDHQGRTAGICDVVGAHRARVMRASKCRTPVVHKGEQEHADAIGRDTYFRRTVGSDDFSMADITVSNTMVLLCSPTSTPPEKARFPQDPASARPRT
jgi:hypothetical protein